MSIHETAVTDWGAFDLPIAPPGRMTEDEFVAWCREHEDLRAEWADGEIIIMSPANDEHCDLNGWLSAVLRVFVDRRKLGKVRGPEMEIRLGAQQRRRVPDLLFVANARLEIIQRTHIEGAPDLAIEIVSPDSGARDWREKYADYQSAGVREYWVIDPLARRVEVYALDGSGKFQRLTEQDGKLISTVLEGFYLRESWLWQEALPSTFDALRELGVV